MYPRDAADVGGTTSGGGTDGGTSGGTTGGNNGGGTTPTAATIADIQTGVVATGDLVEISNAVVTGVSVNKMRQVFVQDISGTKMLELWFILELIML